MEAVAAGDDVALEHALLAGVTEADRRALGLDAVEAHVADLEEQLRPGGEPGGDQVLHDLLLAVDRDPAPARELGERDAVALAVEAQLDPVVHEPLALEALPHAHLDQQVHGALLEHSGAHALLDVLAVAGLEDHRLDAAQVQQLAEHEPGRARPDDADLSALGHGHTL